MIKYEKKILSMDKNMPISLKNDCKMIGKMIVCKKKNLKITFWMCKFVKAPHKRKKKKYVFVRSDLVTDSGESLFRNALCRIDWKH